jgi:ABC-type transporter Mla subunit MlaD
MRIAFFIALACLLAVPALAAESLEATSKRVKELEKTDLVIQEDLARTQVELDTVTARLKKTMADLDAEIAARKTLGEKVAQTEKQLADLTKQLATTTESLTGRLTALDKALADHALKNTQEMTAMRTDFDKQFATQRDSFDKQLTDLRVSFDKEHSERLAAEAELKALQVKQAKQAKTHRLITYPLALLGLLL